MSCFSYPPRKKVSKLFCTAILTAVSKLLLSISREVRLISLKTYLLAFFWGKRYKWGQTGMHSRRRPILFASLLGDHPVPLSPCWPYRYWRLVKTSVSIAQRSPLIAIAWQPRFIWWVTCFHMLWKIKLSLFIKAIFLFLQKYYLGFFILYYWSIKSGFFGSHYQASHW